MYRKLLLFFLAALPIALFAQPKKGAKPAPKVSDWKVLLQNTWVVDSVITEEYSRSGRQRTRKQDLDKIETFVVTKDQIINSELNELKKEPIEYKAIQDGKDRYVIAMGLALKVLEINKNRLVLKSEIFFFGKGGEAVMYFSPISEMIKNTEKKLIGVWSTFSEGSYRSRVSEYDYGDEYGYRNILALELKQDHSMKMITTTGRDSGRWELQSNELKIYLDGTSKDYLLHVNSISERSLVLASKSKPSYSKKLKLSRSEYSMQALRRMVEKDSIQARVYLEAQRRRKDSIRVIENGKVLDEVAPVEADAVVPAEERVKPAVADKQYSSLVAGSWIAARYVDLGGGGNQALGKEARLELYTDNSFVLSLGKKKEKGQWRRSQAGDFLLLTIDKKEVVAPFFLVKSWSSSRKMYEVQELQLTITLPGEKQAKRVLFKSLN